MGLNFFELPFDVSRACGGLVEGMCVKFLNHESRACGTLLQRKTQRTLGRLGTGTSPAIARNKASVVTLRLTLTISCSRKSSI